MDIVSTGPVAEGMISKQTILFIHSVINMQTDTGMLNISVIAEVVFFIMVALCNRADHYIFAL